MSGDNESYILTATFPFGTINKNGDIFTVESISGFPIESGTIVLTHSVPKSVFEKYIEGKEWHVSMECLYDRRIEE